MKKITLIVGMLVASVCTFAQTQTKTKTKPNYRVGLMTALPVDVYADTYKVGLASMTAEISYKVSPKATLTFNSGYIRMSADSQPDFAQIPVLGGVRYALNQNFYFGGSTGISFYNKKAFGSTDFMYVPYIGYQSKHISVDLNYLNTVKKESAMKTLALTVSYTL